MPPNRPRRRTSPGRRRAPRRDTVHSTAAPEALAEAKQPSIDEVFSNIVDHVRAQMQAQSLEAPVDIELNFQQVTMSKSSAVFAKRREQSQMEIRLATRIMPK